MIMTPSATLTPGGAIRRVGVEMAFGALEPRGAARDIVGLHGGEERELGPNRLAVLDSGIGDFEIRWGPEIPTMQSATSETRRMTRTAVEKLATVAGPTAPCEIVCPPTSFRDLGIIDQLFDHLRREGRTGKAEDIPVPLGFELGVDAASLDHGDILAVLRAWCLMCDWLRQDYAPTDMQDIIVFPEPFDLDYRKLVLDPDYRPGMKALADDYITANPTRNKELDLLPLLCHLKPAIVRKKQKGPPVTPRPIFCYRLPRAGLARGGGIVTDEWNRWVEVEALAANPGRLRRMAEAFLSHAGDFVEADWTDECALLLQQ